MTLDRVNIKTASYYSVCEITLQNHLVVEGHSPNWLVILPFSCSLSPTHSFVLHKMEQEKGCYIDSVTGKHKMSL